MQWPYDIGNATAGAEGAALSAGLRRHESRLRLLKASGASLRRPTVQSSSRPEGSPPRRCRKCWLAPIRPGKFNVVVAGERGIVTAMKGLDQRALSTLARNYGWK